MHQGELKIANAPRIKADIRFQQEKTVQSFEDLKKIVRKDDWDFMPRDLLMHLSDRLSKRGIDEQRFASFIESEVKSSIIPLVRQVVVAQKDVSDIRASERRASGAAKAIEFFSEETRIARELLTIAECIKEAQTHKMSTGKYFGNMNEGEARFTIVLNRDKADTLINRITEREERIVYETDDSVFRGSK
jgi:hypothetical protein